MKQMEGSVVVKNDIKNTESKEDFSCVQLFR